MQGFTYRRLRNPQRRRKLGLRNAESLTDLVQRIRKMLTNRVRFLLGQPRRPNRVSLDRTRQNAASASTSTVLNIAHVARPHKPRRTPSSSVASEYTADRSNRQKIACPVRLNC